MKLVHILYINTTFPIPALTHPEPSDLSLILSRVILLVKIFLFSYTLGYFSFYMDIKRFQKRWFYPFPNGGYFQIFLRYVSTWTMLIESPPMSKKLSPKLGFSVQTRTWATAFKSSLARSKSSEQTYPERSSSEKLNVDFRLSSYLKLNK